MSITEACKNAAAGFAEQIIKCDYSAARDFLAPWLRESISEDNLKSITQAASQELPPPGAFSLDGNSSMLEDLVVDDYDPPTKPLSPQITTENFRKWMVIQFAPDPELETGYDACFDLWVAMVELNGVTKIGYLETTGAD
jgi:hypothetical protein